VGVGESSLELLEATAPDSPIAKWIEKRGPGLHHITLRVEDIAAALAELKDRGEASRDAEILLILTGAGLKYEPPPLAAPTDLAGTEEEVLARVRRVARA